MRVPVIHGVIDRRILANFRIDPDVTAEVLPPPFRPKLWDGHAIGGICLIRLIGVRPRCLPVPFGIRSENAAHRIAVEWDEDGGVREGVYITRRDTDSRFNSLVGGSIFPGVHHHARFDVEESEDRLAVALRSDDGDTSMRVSGSVAHDLPSSSVFPTLADASAFFEAGSMGYSATHARGRYDGLELRCDLWRVEPMDIDHVESSYFGDEALFPPGTIAFDSALLMRGIHHEWHAHDDMCCLEAVGV